MPLHATSSGVCHFEWHMPLQVAHATSSGVSHREHATSCHFMPLQVAHATSSGVSHREHATSCHFMPLQVAAAPWACHFMPLHATSSGGRTVSMPLHATSCHFKWREVAWSGEIGLRTSCVLNVKLIINAGYCSFRMIISVSYIKSPTTVAMHLPQYDILLTSLS